MVPDSRGIRAIKFGPSANPPSGRYLSWRERRSRCCASKRELRRNAATRSGGLEYRATTAQWHAERSARRPKQAKLVLNPALQMYVAERLAGVIAAPSGSPVAGPTVCWKGRRHGPRKDRRWAKAWSSTTGAMERSAAASKGRYIAKRSTADAKLQRPPSRKRLAERLERAA